jgi:large exoprotein involved in heme utilization and adhesion
MLSSSAVSVATQTPVTANAFGGRGGNINIDAEGVFLFDSPENIFSASSELGIDGEIQINTPDINFQKELEQSELEILTAEQAIASSCLANNSQQASFTIGSNGGLPKSSDFNYSDANFSLTGVGSLPVIPKKAAPVQRNQDQALIPAEKMLETADGRIFLVTAPYAKRYPLGQKAESLFCSPAKDKEG